MCVCVCCAVSGVPLLLLHIANSLYSDSPHKKKSYLSRAVRLLEPALANPDDRRPTFLQGAGGPFSVGAVVYSELGEHAKANECVLKLKQLYRAHRSSFVSLPSELLNGHCGYIYALLFVKVHLPALIEEELLAELVTMVLDIGERQREAEYNSPVMYTWHRKHYLGAAHGLAGILTLLLQVR